MVVQQRLGADIIDIATAAGTVIARHWVARAGLGVTVSDTGHVTALEAIALASIVISLAAHEQAAKNRNTFR